MNNSTKILSIVVPTYNMEKYLCKCLDSITRDDIPSSLDIILVNDGSTDHSLEIMQEYEKKRPDIITIINKQNGHYGSCINEGIKIAKGKYFRPLDADDWVNTDALIKLVDKLNTTDADFIITPRTEITEQTKIYSSNFKENHLYDIDFLRKQKMSDINDILSMHSMTYRLKLLRDNHLSLLEGYCYTDTEYYLIPLQYSKNFIFFNYDLYQYRLGRKGQSMDAEEFKKNRHHYAMVLNSILNKTQFPKNSIEYNRILSQLITYYGMILFDIISNDIDNKDMQILHKAIKKAQPYLWTELNKALHYVPFIWNITGVNFNFYSRFKKIIGKKKIFHS